MEDTRYSPSEIERVVIEEIRNLTTIRLDPDMPIDRDTVLKKIGIDFVAVGELNLSLEKIYGLRNIDVNIFLKNRTNCGDIINYVDSRLRERYNDR